MPKKAKGVLPSWYVSKLKKEAVLTKPRSKAHKVAPHEKDTNYTVPALLALFGIVLVTGVYFAQSPGTGSAASTNLAGNAYGASIPSATDSQAPTTCEVQSRCDGTQLVRQNADCTKYVSFCQHGCDLTPSGAVCR